MNKFKKKVCQKWNLYPDTQRGPEQPNKSNDPNI